VIRRSLLAAAACAALFATALPGTAPGKVVNLRVYNGTYPTSSFFGAGSVGAPAPFSPFSIAQIDIDQSNGNLIVGSSGYWYKFNSSGTPLAFSAISPNTVVGTTGQSTWSDVAVDNSGGAGGVGEGEQGRIYGMSEGEQRIRGWKANGEPVAGPFGEGSGLAVPGVCGMDVDSEGDVWAGIWNPAGIVQEFNPDGTPTGQEFVATVPSGPNLAICGMEIDNAGNFYISGYCCDGVHKFSPSGEYKGVIDPSSNEAKDTAVDSSDGHIYTAHQGEAGGLNINEYDSAGGLVTRFGAPEGPYPGAQPEGVAVNETTHTVYVTNGGFEPSVDSFVRTGDITIPDVTTGTATVTPSTATIHGEVDPDAANGGAPIDVCNFEWGTDPNNLSEDAPCEGVSLPINSPTAVSATIEGLSTGTTYYYKLSAANEDNGVLSFGAARTFEPAGPPEFLNEAVSDVNTDGARISATIFPGGATATYRIEVGTTTAYGTNYPVPDAETADNLEPENFSIALSGLSPGTTYHYRLFGTNANGPTTGPDHAFTTFPSPSQEPDTCPNAQVRQQTGASRLLDCRAYELASAANTDGYDVESDLVPGQNVLTPRPRAQDRVLYSVHFGAIPGTGEPTNFGPDPYVASRGGSGWSTRYVGIPASGTPSDEPFGSPLAGSSAGLATFAFGGETLCDPCFGDGSSGIPVRLANGSLVQGMQGSRDPGPGAEPSGYVGTPLSDDGSHLVFGSTAQFEPAGNDGSLTIYDRNLNTGKTQVASTLPDGSTMTGTVAELDMSADGSRILIGRLISTDTAGNGYYDLYMHMGESDESVPVADTASGVVFNGMTADGTKVLFTTPDALGGDSDGSADLFRADVTSSSATVSRVSTGTGGTGDSDACDPAPGKFGPDWNAVSGGPDCGVLGLAGGAGLAEGDGTVFFLSPEALDGSGTAGGANLFVATPGGAPRFVATLEPDNELVSNALNNSEVHRYGDFQVTPDGGAAVFASQSSLTGFNTFGHTEVFRYDTSAGSLACASCPPTGAAPTSNSGLALGLNISDDGRVFFTSDEALVLRDTNGRKDVYEWSGGRLELVSTGLSEFDSSLLTVSADGVDVFFFTRATLVPQDENGNLMKIYTAREGGGFLAQPSPPLCAAKDECHGPGTTVAPPPQIGTFKGTGGNKRGCRKGFVKKHGKCVKKKCPKGKKRKGKKCVPKKHSRKRRGHHHG
jgi:hypothetical protein